MRVLEQAMHNNNVMHL